jgi:hypothetical protein
MRIDLKQQLDKCEQERLKSLGDLESEMLKQRERTLKLVAEKDIELSMYRREGHVAKKLPSRLLVEESELNNSDNEDRVGNENGENEDSDETNPANSFMLLNTNTTNDHEPKHILYYSQQIAYRETELNKLRLLKHDLEYKLKQTNDEHSVDIDRLLNQILILKQEIERLKLNQTRNDLNGANLEYIKNVVYNFMTTKDNNVKMSMINAITQILQFTQSEKQRLHSISNKLT